MIRNMSITKKEAKKHILLAFIFICISVVGLIVLRNTEKIQPTQKDIKVVTIGQTSIFVDVVDSDEDRVKGLSGRENLDVDSGMLFLFDYPSEYSFWMPDMNFPIDIIWISDNTVVGIESNVSNEFDPNNPTYYNPPFEVDTVLEVNAGFAEKNNIKIGNLVSFLTTE